jgi:hypothetical protein
MGVVLTRTVNRCGEPRYRGSTQGEVSQRGNKACGDDGTTLV